MLLAAIAAIVALSVRGNAGAARPDLVLHKVKRDRMELTIVERGALESAKNSEIYCRVKTISKAPQIKTLIDDGSEVRHDRPPEEAGLIYVWDEPEGKYTGKKGTTANGPVVVEVHHEGGRKTYSDLLLDLEDSAIQDSLKTQKTTLDTAELAKFKADEALKDQISQNINDIQTAKTTLENARFALMKYTGKARDEVLKPESLATLRRDMALLSSNFGRDAVALAEEDLVKFKSGDYISQVQDMMGQIENAKSDLSQQQDREAWAYRMVKKNYQTVSQAQAETSRRESYQLTLNKVRLNLENLVKSQKLKDLNTYLGDLENAERNLKRVTDHADSMEAQDRKEAAIKKSTWEQELLHYHDILDEIKKCKIHAPQDGMVVYYIPEQARGGGGTQQSIVAQGEPVREGQKLMQIPDLKHMLVNTKVHEAQIAHVHAGQTATVRVDSFGGRLLHGTVETVATVAAQQDFFAADVKVYTTKVAINPDEINSLPGDLKPGMSAEVTIQIQKALENVITVPVQAIVGGSEMGSDRSVVVMTSSGPVQRPVKVGLFNEKMAEVQEGLEEGDEVVLNPKAVLGDKIKTHEPTPPKSATGAPGGPGDPSKKGKGGGGTGKGKPPAAFKQ